MHILLISLIITTVLGGAYVCFLFPWDGEKKPKPAKFAGAGVSEKPVKPQRYNQ